MSAWALTRSASKVSWGGWWVWSLAALAVLLGAGAARAQVNVVLRTSAALSQPTVSGDATESSAEPRNILLSDVADIDPPSSPEGAKVGEIVVGRFDSAAGFVTVSITQVRIAMDAATRIRMYAE